MMNLDPRKMEHLMRQLGVKFEDIKDVKDIIVNTEEGRYIIKPSDVKIINAGGVKTLQAVISSISFEKKEEDIEIEINEEDIKILMEKGNISYDYAKDLLTKHKGDLAQALLEIEMNKN